MKDYQATFYLDCFTISTCITADNNDQAERYAIDRIAESSGLYLSDCEYELKLEITGEYV